MARSQRAWTSGGFAHGDDEPTAVHPEGHGLVPDEYIFGYDPHHLVVHLLFEERCVLDAETRAETPGEVFFVYVPQRNQYAPQVLRARLLYLERLIELLPGDRAPLDEDLPDLALDRTPPVFRRMH